jgi:hypothetical protein
MKYVTAKFLEEGDTITLAPEGEDYLINEKTVDLNGTIGLLVTQLGKGTQYRRYIDPDADIAVVETKAERQERRERFENTVGDSTDAYYQTKRERRMGL